MMPALLEFTPLIQGAAVVIAATITAMWVNDRFDLGGYVQEESQQAQQE